MLEQPRPRLRPEPSPRPLPKVPCEEQRIQDFGRELDTLRREFEAKLGEADRLHIERVMATSTRLELLGRGLLHFSFEPLGFGAGVVALWIHKCLELMEIGHMALHGAYDRVSDDPRLTGATFKWKSPLDEACWRVELNVKHHQYTNIVGRDPDMDYGEIRLSSRIGHKWSHRLQPLTSLATWLGFATAINLHVTGVLNAPGDLGEEPKLHRRTERAKRSPKRAFFAKAVRYYGREFFLFPALAGPFWWKVAFGNLLSDIGRDLCAGAIIYCGHVGATDYPRGAKAGSRARWYAMQAESASNVELAAPLSILCGGLDKQIEHHLFPRLPPNRLREIAPRVRTLCKKYGVNYRSAGFGTSLSGMLKKLQELSRPNVPGAGDMALCQSLG